LTSVIHQVQIDDKIDNHVSDANDSNKVNKTDKTIKDKFAVDTQYTVKTLLNSVAADNILSTILKERTFKANKIFLEGSYLFNIYLLHILSNNIYMKITTSTIRRCMNLLIFKPVKESVKQKKSKKSKEINKVVKQIKARAGSDQKEFDIINSVKSEHFNFNISVTGDRLNDFIKIKAIMKAIEPSCDIYFTNLKEHVCRNFKKYQSKYLLFKLKLYCRDNKYKISDSNLKFMLFNVQHKINGNSDYSYKVEKRKNQFEKLSKDINIDNFILSESKILKDYISFDICTGNEINTISETNLFYYLRYFYFIQNEFIEKANKKESFQKISIIPHLVPKIRYIRWEARSLYAVYNVWKRKLLNNDVTYEDIGVKAFENEFNKYISEMFPKIKDKYINMIKRYPSIRSISTNGCSISIGFQKLIVIKKKQIPSLVEQNNVNLVGGEISDEQNKANNNVVKKVNNTIKYLEDEYPKIITVNKKILGGKDAMYEATELRCSEQFLDNFYVVGCDPGNQVMFDFSSETGLHTTVHKNYYNDVAHVTRNIKLVNEKIIQNNMNEIYAKMSLDNTKTTKIENYMKYVEIVRKNWQRIWKHCTNTELLSLSMNSYTYKEKAVNRIAKEICKKVKDERNIYPRQQKYYNKDQHNKKKDKPILFAMGKGNGGMTISNTKGTAGKGPIKRIVKELSKYSVVVLTPEDNTSQLCNICQEQVEHVKVYKRKTKVEQSKMNELEKSLEENRIKNVRDLVRRMKDIERMNKEMKGMGELEIVEELEKINERDKKKIETELEEYKNIYCESYKEKAQ